MHALRLLFDKDGLLRGLSQSQVTRARNVLRSSWLYRQRAAGRLKHQEQLPWRQSTTCSMLCASHVLAWIPIFPPSAPFPVLWDSMLQLALVYIAVFTPLQAAFYREFEKVFWHAINLTCELLFLLTPMLRFRRGFTHDGLYIADPLFIAAHYVRGDFLTDAIAAFPYAWLSGIRLTPESDGSPSRLAGERMVPLLRVMRIIIPLARFLSTADSNVSSVHGRINPGVTRVVRSVLLLLFTCHWIGCMWWCIGELEQDGLLSSGGNLSARTDPEALDRWGPSEWLRDTQDLANQYAHSFMWGAGMMTGYVPKDVVPHTLPEVIVTVLALFFGLIVNTAIISSTTSALQSISFKSARVVHKMQNIHIYMRHKRVPPGLANKITSFYEYQLSPYRSGEGQHELSDLPPRLAMELMLHTHQDIFRDCPIFRLVPPPTALSLVERFESIVFVPGEIVIHEGKDNAALYVINRGLVQVWVHDSTEVSGQKALTVLTDSDFFGEQTLLKTITSKSKPSAERGECKANATCQCTSYCDMFRLTSEDFMAVLEDARVRQTSWNGKDVAGILSDAADERNMRTDAARRKRSLMWAAAGKKAIRENRQAKSREHMASMAVGLLSYGAQSPLGCATSRFVRTASPLSRRTKQPPLPPQPQVEPSPPAPPSPPWQPCQVPPLSSKEVGGDLDKDEASRSEPSALQLVVGAAVAALNRAASRPSSAPGSLQYTHDSVRL